VVVVSNQLTKLGTFLDSTSTGTFQQSFRTARAIAVKLAPELNRIYMLIGSAVVAYDLRTFFDRLAANEPLVDATHIPVTPNVAAYRAAPYEQFLQWDKFFYAENGGGWEIIVVDGQQRLFQFDYDDRGYIYLAYSTFGWGIVKDDGGTGGGMMSRVYQDLKGAGKPVQIASFKAGGKYYALLQGGAIYDTTIPTAPKLVRNAGYITQVAKTSDHIAVLNSTGTISIGTVGDFAAGLPAMAIFSSADPNHPYNLITTNGTNFYGDAITTVGAIVKGADGKFTQTVYPLTLGISRQAAFATGFQYGAGFIAVAGMKQSTGSWDLGLLRVDAGVPSVLDIGDYFNGRYKQEYINIDDGLVVSSGGKLYLVVMAGGIGDVYALDVSGAPALPPPVVVPPPVVTPPVVVPPAVPPVIPPVTPPVDPGNPQNPQSPQNPPVDPLPPPTLTTVQLLGRFNVSVKWTTSDGKTGDGTVIPCEALGNQTALFWFFSPTNLEIAVKMIDGGQHFWVFAAGLTNVGVEITVTDTTTGRARVYTNWQGTAFQPIQDTSAF
jgi:hypothetical protein